jgi:hypothetical protein
MLTKSTYQLAYSRRLEAFHLFNGISPVTTICIIAYRRQVHNLNGISRFIPFFRRFQALSYGNGLETVEPGHRFRALRTVHAVVEQIGTRPYRK